MVAERVSVVLHLRNPFCAAVSHFSDVNSVLQRVAVRCRVLQCVAACCSVLGTLLCAVVLHFSNVSSVLPCVAVCCNVLHCVAVCYASPFVQPSRTFVM